MKIILSFLSCLFLVLSDSCNSGVFSSDTPTSGIIYIGADESLSPILDEEIFVFGSLYKYAAVNPAYMPGERAFKYLRNDSCRFILVTRMPDKADSSWFLNQKIRPRITTIAQDAIVVIVNKENKDTSFSYKTLSGILNGEIARWSQVKAENDSGKIKVIFDHQESGIVRLIQDKFGKDQKLNKEFFALHSELDVMDYVSKDLNAIGFISSKSLSDYSDSITQNLVKNIKVVWLSDEGKTGFYLPDQSSIASGKYPLVRTIYALSREARSGLGTGFIAFMTADKGQRIILKAGLVPAVMPPRRIETYQ